MTKTVNRTIEELKPVKKTGGIKAFIAVSRTIEELKQKSIGRQW